MKHRRIERTIMAWTAYTLLMAAAVYGFLAIHVRIFRETGQSYCMLDCMHKLEAPWDYGLWYLPVTAGYVLIRRRTHPYAGFVVKYQKIEEVWTVQVKELAVRSALCSVIYGVICSLFSWMSACEIMNWGRENSLFFQANESVYGKGALTVFFTFFLFNYVKTFLAVLVLVLLESWRGALIQGYILLGAVIVMEWCFADIPVFLNRFSIAYGNFKSPWTIWLLAGAGGIVIGAAYLAGRMIWKDKEFYE